VTDPSPSLSPRPIGQVNPSTLLPTSRQPFRARRALATPPQPLRTQALVAVDVVDAPVAPPEHWREL
jgi:hypothetical protein